MASCEELAATISALQAALIVDDATISAAQTIKTVHQMELWYNQYNFFLQDCGSGGGGGSGSGDGLAREAARPAGYKFPAKPVRTPAELCLIMTNPELYSLHQKCEERATMLGAA